MYSSPNYTLFNPYRPSRRKGYLLKRYPHAPPYRLLSLKELRDIKETILDQGESDSPYIDSSFPSNFYYFLKFGRDSPLLFSSLVPSTDSFSLSVLMRDHDPSSPSNYRYYASFVIIAVSSPDKGLLSFYSFLFTSSPSLSATSQVRVQVTGIRSGDICYIVPNTYGISDVDPLITSSTSNPWLTPTSTGAPFFYLLGNDGTVRVISTLRQTFRAFEISSSTTLDIDFSGSTPQFPFLVLPLRTFKFSE